VASAVTLLIVAGSKFNASRCAGVAQQRGGVRAAQKGHILVNSVPAALCALHRALMADVVDAGLMLQKLLLLW